MKEYIGTKIVKAEPMSKDGVDGYKVIYDNPNNTKYQSWSPKDVFDEAYTELSLNTEFVHNKVVDMFCEANKKFGQFMPQQYVCIFLELCDKYGMTLKKDDQ